MSHPAEAAAPETAPARLPRQIAYIIGNEGCERFSFYGMRNILTQFLVSSSLLYAAAEAVPRAEREGAAKDVFHTFVLGVYFFPLLGGWVSDRLLGKYRTILYLSLVYCVGQACLAVFVDDKAGFYLGLFLIAWGRAGSSRASRRSSATSSTSRTSRSPRSSSTPSTGSSTSAPSSRRS